MAIIAHGTSPRPVRPGPWAVAIALEWEYGIPGPKSTAGRSILSGRELFPPPPLFNHFYCEPLGKVPKSSTSIAG